MLAPPYLRFETLEIINAPGHIGAIYLAISIVIPRYIKPLPGTNLIWQVAGIGRQGRPVAQISYQLGDIRSSGLTVAVEIPWDILTRVAEIDRVPSVGHTPCQKTFRLFRALPVFFQ